jgi:hypothetical protein
MERDLGAIAPGKNAGLVAWLGWLPTHGRISAIPQAFEP